MLGRVHSMVAGSVVDGLGIRHTIFYKAVNLNEVKQFTHIHYVVVPGYTDDMVDIHKLAEFIAPMDNVQLLELLPYHRMGRKKWIELDQTYALEDVESPTPNFMRKLKSTLGSDYGLKVLL